MLSQELTAAIEAALVHTAGRGFRIRSVRAVGGGCISDNYRIDGDDQRFFVKVATDADHQFRAEADGLAALARCASLVVPQVVTLGRAGRSAFLLMTHLDLEAEGDEARLGNAVAALHDIIFPSFGWPRDNYIGRTVQINTPDADWIHFYRERRLLPQLRMAAQRGAPELLQGAGPLIDALPSLFQGYRPVASLLHGDLWAGNKGFVGGRPCLFDPAVHAGDAETDLAMTELFGGFSSRFYAAYRAARRIDENYPIRRPVYQLYHVLNHYNLFGGAYARQAANLMKAAVSGVR